MLEDFSKILQGAGKASEVFVTPDGARLLLLPYGARVLALYAPGSEENFFWTNPLLDAAETARSLFAGTGWHNTGGDRTWVAPEVDTFFPDATSQQYLQPRQLDMSDYVVERTGGGCQLSRQMTLHLARPNRDVSLRLTKWFGPAMNPLRYERDLAAVVGGVQYAGYTQRVAMRLSDESAARVPEMGIWNLVQLPPGGEMLVPLYARCVPQKCFGNVPEQCVTIEDHVLRVKVDFAGSHKIAVKAVALCGRTGYVYNRDGRWSLVVRNFFVKPSAQYIDVQRHDPQDYGYGFQMCRVDEVEFGSFCEMEYHAVALGALPEPSLSEDVSETWAFRGTRDEIDAIAHRLLGTGIESSRGSGK